MEYIPHHYQQDAYQHILENRRAGLFLDMGLGKTVITLTAIRDLIFDELEIAKVLIIAPKRVARSVWTGEIEKWAHLQGLTVSLIQGDAKQRKQALKTPAHIYTIGVDNVSWLCAECGAHSLPFDMLVVDELSKFKSPKSQRFKALRQVCCSFERVVGLTGTPSPNGLIDLWSQMFLLDCGQRLFKTVTRYRETYFSHDPYRFKYELLPGAEERIKEKISDICISMHSKDYLDLPDMINNVIELELPDDVMKQYKAFEEESFLHIIEHGGEITAVNGAVLVNKLLQFSNGAVYYQTKAAPGEASQRQWQEFHDIKLQAVEDIIEEQQGKPVLIAYAYEHDKLRLLEYLKRYKPKVLKTEQDEKDWNAGKIPVMITHPASAGHGLNLQAGGSTAIWFGETWNLELHQQFNKRLHRQGQKNTVVIHRLVCKGTEDVRVMRALEAKARVQDTLFDNLRARLDEFRREYNL